MSTKEPNRAERDRRYSAENRDKIIAYMREYYAKNKKAILAKQKEKYQRDKETILARQKLYYMRTREQHSAYAKRPEVRERSRKYEEANRAARNESKRFWRLANPGKGYAATRRYVVRHREVKRHWDKQRRARKAGATGSHTLIQWQEKLAQLGAACTYCGATTRIVKDHDIPLARGGSDDIGNIVPACHHCNSAKRSLTGAEFRVFLRRLSDGAGDQNSAGLA